MINWKKIRNRSLFPPIWLLLVLTVLSAVLLVFVFANDFDGHPVSYAVYLLSFYTLSAAAAFCVKILPKRYKAAKEKIYENKFGNRYLTDVAFRTRISLYLSFGFNLFYAAVNAVSALLHDSAWFGVYGVYYTIMAVMRFLLARYVDKEGIRRDGIGELKRCRLCACILMAVNIALSAVVFMMVRYGRGFVYRGYMIYVMAMYAFWATASAMIDLVKYRKYKSPVISMTKVIKFASALMSMLALETAMFAAFGDHSSAEMQNTMMIATGGGIAVIVSAMSVYRIYSSTKEIKKSKKESGNEQ